MGWYTNYEVEFAEMPDWDDEEVKRCLEPFTVQHLYLRDMDVPRLILCVYSQDPVEVILKALMTLYPIDIRYRFYNTKFPLLEPWFSLTH